MKKIIALIFVLSSFSMYSQIKDLKKEGGLRRLNDFNNNNQQQLDSLNNDEIDVKLDGKTKYTDYKIINYKGDTSIIDTTLTIEKDYLFNFRRKDNFELLEFQNQGQTFNSLGYDFSNITTLPDFGFTAKHFNFYNIEDIYYYQVPTPTTAVMYRSGNEQGQVMDALFTLNFSRRFNVAVAYKGIRSLGYYRRSLASQGNFRTSFHYQTPKSQYQIKGHVAMQDLTNQENGGITDAMVTAFENDDPNFSDRARMDINLADAENVLDGKRYYVEHSFRLFSTETYKEKKVKTIPIKLDSISKNKNSLIASKKDSLSSSLDLEKDSIANKKIAAKKLKSNAEAIAIKEKENAKRDFTNIKIGHSILLDNKFYKFNQASINTDFFGSANADSNVSNVVDYQLFNNQLFLEFNSKYIFGNFRARVHYATVDYGYNSLQNINGFINNNVTNDKIGGDAVGFGADWNAKVGKFQLNASATVTPGNGYLAGNDFRGEALYKKDSVFTVKGRVIINSKSPNFNTLLHQSSYDNFNWQNRFNTVDTRNIGGNFESKWGNASLDLTNISNYVYFDETGNPQQTSGNVNYLKLKVNKEFRVGKFALNNTVMYQNVSSGNAIFRVPELVTRNTLYYADDWFKGKPLFVNIGLTFKYFSEYKANTYNPLLAEFQLQNATNVGGYPMVDFFFNGRVRRTRLYFKLENVSSFLGNRDYFSAPNHPYRDFSIRFGVVWNWFI